MRQVRSDWESALGEMIQRSLKPIIRMLLRLGMGANDFSSIAKTVFVQVASEEYGIRGRPTNSSRIAAMTGLSRKEVAKIRAMKGIENWRPAREGTPMNEVLHYWHVDPEFVDFSGRPRSLPLEGEGSFESLVGRYAGDIPVGAMRRELLSRGAISITAENRVDVHKRFVHVRPLDEYFLRNMAFSLDGLCTTLVHNSEIEEGSEQAKRFLQRTAWTNHLTSKDIERFRAWVRQEGAEFVERADDRIGEHELPRENWDSADHRTVGVGLYYFELRQSDDLGSHPE